jgi:hypothetical protein
VGGNLFAADSSSSLATIARDAPRLPETVSHQHATTELHRTRVEVVGH